MKKRKKLKSKRKRRSNTKTKKVSEMLIEYASDFINMGDDIEEKRGNLVCAMVAWNLSLLTGKKRAKKINETMEIIRSKQPELDECDLDDVRDNINKLIAEKERLFPNVKTFIVSAEIEYHNDGNYYITAASTDMIEGYGD